MTDRTDTSTVPAGLQAFSLAGRTALVTGAGGGVGAAVAVALAAAGAAVLVTDINKDAAAAVSHKITAAGGTAEPFALDVCNAANARDAVAAAAASAAAPSTSSSTTPASSPRRCFPRWTRNASAGSSTPT